MTLLPDLLRSLIPQRHTQKMADPDPMTCHPGTRVYECIKYFKLLVTFNTIEHPSDRVVFFAVYTKLISHDGSPLSRVPISGIVTPRKHFLLDCEQSLFFAKLLHAKPNHAGGEATCREKRGRKPEKKK